MSTAEVVGDEGWERLTHDPQVRGVEAVRWETTSLASRDRATTADRSGGSGQRVRHHECVWESRDTQPDEPGWWLASDGRWYPSESLQPPSPRPRFFDSQDRPNELALGAVFAASVGAAWLVIGWDLSTVDGHGQPLHHSFPRSTWMFVVGVAAIVAIHAWAGWVYPQGWKWIGAAGTLGVEAWYLWRGFAGRVDGANMAGAGAVMLLPVIVCFTALPAWLASHRATRITT